MKVWYLEKGFPIFFASNIVQKNANVIVVDISWIIMKDAIFLIL